MILHAIFWICVFLIIYPYFVFPIILIILNRFCKHVTQNDNTIEPFVTLIIPAYNEKNIIGKKILNSIEIEYPKDKLEILIGSDGSNDGTNEIIEECLKERNLITFVPFKQRRGKISVLNDLTMRAKGEVLLFSDANCMLNCECLKHIVKHFKIQNVGCVSGVKRIIGDKEDNISTNEGAYWKFESFLKEMESNIYSLIGSDGAVFAIRKELYQKQESDTVIDDFMISMQVLLNKRKRIVYEKNAIAFEASEGSFRDEYKRKTRIAAGAFQSLIRLGFVNPFTYEGFAYFSHKILRWISPIFFTLCFASNLILAFNNNVFYKASLFLQMVYYILTLLGYYNNRLNRKNKLLDFIFYFNMTIFTQVLGFIKYKKGKQKVTWEKQNR